MKIASLLLQYPSEELRSVAAEVASIEIAPARGRQQPRLREFCAWYARRPLGELERLYVDGFDFSKQCSLHLTYHVHGDRRQRGIAMLELKRAYRQARFEPPGDELPDYLPMMLEFAALAPDGAGEALLEEHRVSLELIAAALRRDRSPFAPLLEVVLVGLGRLSARKLARVRRLAAEGPPSEQVGLEPFAPPEVMPPDGEAGAARPLVGGWEARG
jgi:nitrate reductase delta subunit